MRIIYNTHNMKNIGNLIKLVKSNIYYSDELRFSAEPPTYTEFMYMILEINKKKDLNLIMNMLSTIATSMKYIKDTVLIETDSYYYLSISFSSIKYLTLHHINSFTHKLSILADEDIKQDNLNYQIAYSARLDFQILNDMRDLAHIYYYILNTTELNRTFLNQLLRLSFRVRTDILTATKMSEDMNILYALDNNDTSYRNIQNANSITLQLKDIVNWSTVNTSANIASTDQNKAIQYLNLVRTNTPDTNAKYKLLTMSNLCNIFVINTIEEIIQFANSNKDYHHIYLGIIEYLNYNVNISEFIFTGKERS